jgi:AcrR family transcriptional regulator
MIQARAIRTRQAVLDAAREVFSESGFEGGRVDEIARRSRANKQRIYAYFGDKAGLFAEVQHEAISALADLESTLLPQIEADPSQLGRILVDGYLKFHESNPQFWRLIGWANLSSIAPSSGDSHRAPVLARLRAAYAAAQARQAAPSGIAFDTWFVMLSSVVLFLFANQRSASVNMGIDLTSAATRQRLVDEMLRVLHHPQTTGTGTGKSTST